EDMLAAMRTLLAAPADADAVDAMAATLAAAAGPADASAFAAYGELFRALVAIEDDPFPASRLSRALARRVGFDPELRGRLATAAIAMSAASGDGADSAIEFIDAITAAGVRPFASAEDAEKPASTADILVRASGVFSMVGDQAGGETMLLEAIARDPDHAGGLNNLVYARIVRGTIDDETVAMAERAAKASPDDPGILDTIGLVRYHQGVLRDGAGGPGAISLYRQALRLRPDQPSLETLDHLGDALWRDGDQQGAIRCWQEVPRVAMLRFPPGPLARNLVEYQRREFGVELVEPEQYIRRQYGAVVERAERKLGEVARGAAPSIEDCRALR
ncbi:MAG: tetratricopeptide repeat protein, partial [Planctomycetota bacterium]